MAQQTMYSGLVNSPETTITNNISTTDTIIYVLDPARVPSDLPNLMTLGTGTNAETVLVTAINDNALTVTRGFQGIAKDWLAGTIIARNFTAYDHDTFKNNIKDLNTNKVDNSRVLTNVPTNAKFTDTITPIANNLTETVEGKALDATQGKILDGKIGNLSNSFTSHKADNVQHMAYATATGTNAYIATITGITALTEGLSVKIKFTNANTGAATLNINGFGAKAIQKSNSNALSSGNIKAEQIVHLVYTGTVFQLLGEGGEYGTAAAAQVLSPYTIGTESGLVAGTIPSKGAAIITPGTADQTIAAGQYLSGIQTVKGDANLIGANILSGKSIFGVGGEVIAGKQFASGTVTGQIIAAQIEYIDGSGTANVPGYVLVSGLTFVPALIIAHSIKTSGGGIGMTVYTAEKIFTNYSSGQTILCLASTKNNTGTTTYGFKLTSGYLYVGTSFRLPIMDTTTDVTIKWYAIGA